MPQVNTLVITGYGTNGEQECAHAAQVSGADSVTVTHFSELIAGRVQIASFNFIILPGGSQDGDDLGAGQAAAQRWKHVHASDGRPLLLHLLEAIEFGSLVLGIGNGFQLLTKLGLIPALNGNYLESQVALAPNASGRFEDRWCRLTLNPATPCIFTQGISSLFVPARFAEGNVLAMNEGVLRQLAEQNLIVARYADLETGEPTLKYPENPSGSNLGIAGLCDPSGHVFGIMPHPESYNHPTNHPAWTRGCQETLGLAIFENAIRYLKKNG